VVGAFLRCDGDFEVGRKGDLGGGQGKKMGQSGVKRRKVV
jgi:hypothetical protein